MPFIFQSVGIVVCSPEIQWTHGILNLISGGFPLVFQVEYEFKPIASHQQTSLSLNVTSDIQSITTSTREHKTQSHEVFHTVTSVKDTGQEKVLYIAGFPQSIQIQEVKDIYWSRLLYHHVSILFGPQIKWVNRSRNVWLAFKAIFRKNKLGVGWTQRLMDIC